MTALQIIRGIVTGEIADGEFVSDEGIELTVLERGRFIITGILEKREIVIPNYLIEYCKKLSDQRVA